MSTIQNNFLKAYNIDLIFDVPRTYLNTELTSVGVTLVVESISGIGAGDHLLIGEFGQEKSEIVRVSAVVSPGTITLSAATVFTHERGVTIYRIDRNQVEFSRSTTLSGVKNILTTVSIQADALFTTYEDETNTTGFGFYRFKNSADATYSKYSESIPYEGYGAQTLKVIFDSALMSLGLKNNDGQPTFTQAVTRDDAFQAVLDCQEEIAGMKKRWSYLTDFDNIISELATGEDTYSLPSNISFENGNPAILALRIGSQKDMSYIDKEDLNIRRRDVVKTTLADPIVGIGDITVTLADSSDFSDTGSIQVVSDDGETIDTIDYTANNRTTNVLSGVTGIAAAVSAGANVWQGASFDKPTHWTAFEDSLVIDLPPSADWKQSNLIADLYTRPSLVNDLADEAQFPAFVIKPYIAFRLSEIIDNGPSSRSQVFYQRYSEQKTVLISGEQSGQFVTLKPIRRVDSTTHN